MTRFVTSLAAAALAVSVSIAAQPPSGRAAQPPLGPNQWLVDSGHSAASFSVRHLMVSTVRGQLGAITGTVEYDGKDVRTIKADVSIDVKAINTQNANRDGDLRGPDFFDAVGVFNCILLFDRENLILACEKHLPRAILELLA